LATRDFDKFAISHFQYFSGLEEAVYRNITACKQFADTVRSAYGPNGMNKMVINHIEKLFVTNDAVTIVNELEVEHPAAKLLVLASKMQELCYYLCWRIASCGRRIASSGMLIYV